MEWSAFSEKLLPKVFKLAALEYTSVSRNAAAQIMTAAAIVAAEKKAIEGTVLYPYMELCQDSDMIIRKTVLNNLKLIFQKVEPSEVERLFFSDLVMHLNDPNAGIRGIIIDVILTSHKLFSTPSLLKEFVPQLIKEIEQGWKDSDCWLLQNFALAIGFLQERELVQDEYIPAINKFFDV